MNIFYCHTGLVITNAIATRDCIHDPAFRHYSPSVFIRGDLMLKLKTLYTRQHDVICQKDANILVANSYRHPFKGTRTSVNMPGFQTKSLTKTIVCGNDF